MKRMQAGFTMIELIVVIVILGVLAAVAMPKFTDMSGDAEAAAVKGVAGAAGSAMNINYGARKVGNATAVAVDNCQDAAGLMQGGALPAGYSIASVAIAAEATATCTVTKGTHTADFVGLGIN